MPVGLALIHLLLALLAFHQAPYTGGDDATYISLARSLLERHEYRDIWDPAMPLHTQYPPVFPMIVAGGLAMGLDIVTKLRLAMVIISTLAVFVSCLWLRRVTTAGIAFCAGFFIALSPEVVRLGMEVLSDYTFWLFSILAVLAWRQAEGERSAIPVKKVFIAAIVTLLAYITRSAGAPLLLAVFIWLALRKDFRAFAITAALSAPPIFAWWLRGRHANGGGYLAPFLAVDPYDPAKGNVDLVEILKRFGANLHNYSARHIPRMIDGSPRQMLWLGASVGLIAIIGWSLRAKKPSVAEIWFPIYVGLVLLWPVTWGGGRFLMPIAPLIALYAVEPIAKLASNYRRPAVIAIAIIVGACVLIFPDIKNQIDIGTGCRARYAEGERFPCTDPAFAQFFEEAEKARGNLPAGSVVLSRKPTIYFVHSGYQSRLYPLSKEPDSLLNLAFRINAHYVVIDQITDLAPRYLHPVLLARRDDFCVIPELSLENAVLVKIEIGGPPRPPGSPPNVFRACSRVSP
jgi:hypothetical protein